MGKAKRSFLARLWTQQGGRCFYCDGHTEIGLGLSANAATRDHVFRSSERIHYPENIRHISVMACRRCNEERGCLPAHEYITVHGARICAKQEEYTTSMG